MKHGKTDLFKMKNFLGDKISRKMIITAAAGILALLVIFEFFPAFFRSDDSSEETDISELAYISEMETKLKKVLSQTKGVGNCEIVITAEGGTEYIYATETTDKNRKTVSEDKTQTDTDTKISVRTVTGNRTETPLVEKEVYPQIRGVVVICDGGSNSRVKSVVSDITATLLGITKDKIVVEARR